MANSIFATWLLVSLSLIQLRIVSASRWNHVRKNFPLIRNSVFQNTVHRFRGGATTSEQKELDSEGHDEGRYSRQVYTLGAKAHGRIRTSTIFIDGPMTSGLVYECTKNLALSGVRKIVLLTSDDQIDQEYHNPDLDDLGKSFQTAARSELGLLRSDLEGIASASVLKDFLVRLNPSVSVSVASRASLSAGESLNGAVLCIDRPFNTQSKINELARKNGLCFVAVETAGVYGGLFCDFGPSFEVDDVDGEAPLVTPLDHVEDISDLQDVEARTIGVYCVEGEKHDVSPGDYIRFLFNNGDKIPEKCKVLRVINPFHFEVQLEAPLNESDRWLSVVKDNASSFSREKIPIHLSFEPLAKAAILAANNDALFAPSDLDKSFDIDRRTAIFSCFKSLSTFVNEKKILPGKNDWDVFYNMVKQHLSPEGVEHDESLRVHHCKNFLSCCAAKLAPVQALFGAIGAQETLKAATGLYHPVQQFLFYDCDELLVQTDKESTSETKTQNMNQKEESGHAYILGKSFQELYASKKLFVVGAGAIGCELLKNLSAMGFGTVKDGCIVLTDMDTIEQSNLSRQLLFRDTDIGKFKSVAAKACALRFNPLVRIETHTSRVGEEEKGVFDNEFWSAGIDVVLNALDNVEARLYIDDQCVKNQKPLVDAGTLGAKGNVQVVVPHQSESYGSSVDPPEPAIPVCTLKNFPYAIAHTIQWGRDLFGGLFQRRPKQVNDLIESLDYTTLDSAVEKMRRQFGDEYVAKALKELSEDLPLASTNGNDLSQEAVRRNAVSWAIALASSLFRDSIIDLLDQHPLDSLDEEGEPFWSGTRRCPTPLEFSTEGTLSSAKSVIHKNFVQFVRSAAKLRIETLQDEPASDQEASTVSLIEVEDALSLSSRPNSDSTTKEAGDESRYIAKVAEESKKAKKFLNGIEFEKDDDSNGHVAFITAASNLRALCYGIPPADEMETRRIAGNIVPAMITTTAVVSALSCIELLKLIKEAPLEVYRNGFINLALPFFAFTVPLPAEEVVGLRGRTFTIWDRIELREGKNKMTLKRFLKRLRKKVIGSEEGDTIAVSTVSYGPYMLYASFLHEDDDDIMKRTLWDLVEEAMASDEDIPDRDRAQKDKGSNTSGECPKQLELTVIMEDLESGEDVEIPLVYVIGKDRQSDGDASL